MTAQGEDLLAYLDRAITQRVDAALKTLDLADRADARRGQLPVPWVFTSNADMVVGEIRDADSGIIRVRSTWPDEGNHITLNDPRSVLRRCAADRKLIELHGPVDEHDLGCKGCGFSNQEESMVDDYEDCPVLRALAEGYGWTEGER